MKRLYIVVEGQSEQEFIKTIVAQYFLKFEIYSVTPILIRTSKQGRGGFVNYQHLKNDIENLLKSQKDIVVSMLVDYFRCPELPFAKEYDNINDHSKRVNIMEQCIAKDISDCRFIPYIQLHEFEALLYSSNSGFEYYFSEEQAKLTEEIITEFNNPELINSSPEKAPSKRLLKINNQYNKVIDGNLIALEVGMSTILTKCPRFNTWILSLIEACKE